MRVHREPTYAVGESPHAMTPTDSVHRGIGSLDVVVRLEIPHDPDLPHVIGPTQRKELLEHVIRRLVRVVVRASLESPGHETKQ